MNAAPCRWLTVLGCIALLAALLYAPAGQARYASIVIDAHSGEILHERHSSKKLHPASLTKMMTLYMLFEALERGTLTLDSRLRVSRHAESMPASKLYLPAGSSIRVEDAIRALVAKSANDVAVVVAEALAGSEARFAREMTIRAHSLGMRDTQFRNASGLHHPQQVSTARDMARLSQLLIFRYRPFYSYFNTVQFRYKGRLYKSHNHLMRTYPGIDGLKTGYIRASGFNLASSAVREGRRLIGVVFGGRTAKTRNAHMADLLDQAFARADDRGLPRLAVAMAPQPERKPTAYERARPVAAAVPAPGRKPRHGAQSGAVLAQLNPVRRAEAGTLSRTAFNGAPDEIPVIFGEGDSGGQIAALMQETWSVQVGAFARHSDSQQAIFAALGRAPDALAGAVPAIAPLKGRRGTIYRARFTGLDQRGAQQVCRAIRDCFELAPQPIN